MAKTKIKEQDIIQVTSSPATAEQLAEDLAVVLEGSFDGILVTDGEGNALYANSSYERISEITREELFDKAMKDLINPVWLPNSVVYVVAEQKQPVSKKQVTKSGRNIMVTGTPIFDDNGDIKRIVVNVRDITEIYTITEELRNSKEMTRRYIESISELTGYEQPANTPILAVSEPMRQVMALAERVANFEATVLILGESGVGKEEVAKFIHNKGVRKDKPFVALNCGAVPETLLESELFGYEKGAFTGAVESKDGIVQAAEHGTVFLDEIGETPLDFQVKLLRFLESKEARRVGSVEPEIVDVRVIAATNRDLKEMVERGTFREDLYYRLNVVQIEVPPLRKRKKDIMPLASMFLHRYNERYNQNKLFSSLLMQELEDHRWEGNVRELKNVIENMVIVSNNEYLQPEDLPWISKDRKNNISAKIKNIASSENVTLQEALEAMEIEMYRSAIAKCRTTRQIAEMLDVNQSTVVRKIHKYDLGEEKG